jgi:uncharacterized protein YbaR (Trm112 family)
MTKYDAQEIRAIFDRGENVIDWIRSCEGTSKNSQTAILYSYDAQAGSYLSRLADPSYWDFINRRGKHLATLLDELSPHSLVEAGVGEASTLASTLRQMAARPAHVLGFDLSLSRLLFAHKHLADEGIDGAVLFTGALDRIPLASDSVDVVLTFHAVESNHGCEDVILSELVRVAGRYLVMIEPCYENAPVEARARMDRLGYARGLLNILAKLGYPARRVEKWPLNFNPLNEASLIVVEKNQKRVEIPPSFVSPISGHNLICRRDCWFCPDDGHAFPIIAGIPCMTLGSGVLASKLADFDETEPPRPLRATRT